MTSISPHIIFNLNFSLYGSSDEKSTFYKCGGDFDIIDYLDRLQAQENLSDADIERVKHFLEISNKSEKSIVDYAHHRHGSSGIFTSEGVQTKESINDIKLKLRTTQSNIWHSVLSFTPEIAAKFCNSRKEAQQIILDTFPSLFKENSIKFENVDWFGAFHTNTQNPHIHLVFWEKTPQNINSKGEKCYTREGMFPEKTFASFKGAIAYKFNSEKFEYFHLRDEVKTGIINSFYDDKKLLEFFAKNSEDILKENKLQYGRYSASQQLKIDNFVKIIISRNPELLEKNSRYLEGLQKTQDNIIKLHKENHIKNIPENALNFYSSRKSELDSRLGNCFLRNLKQYVILQNDIAARFNNQLPSSNPELCFEIIKPQFRTRKPKCEKAIFNSNCLKEVSTIYKALTLGMMNCHTTEAMSDAEFKEILKREGKKLIYENEN